MSGPAIAGASAPPPPPPLDPAKQADELITLNTHDACKGARCHPDTDGVGVGTQLAGAAASDPKQARAVFDKVMDKTPAAGERREVAHGLVQTLNYNELRKLAAMPESRAMLERARTELQGGKGGQDKTDAARIDTALKGAKLEQDPGFKKLDPLTQGRLLGEIGRQEDHPKAVDNLVALAGTHSFQASTPDTRGALLDAMTQHPQDALFREGLTKLADDPSFNALNPAQRTAAVAAFEKVAKSTAYQGSAGSPAHGIAGKHVSAENQQKVLDNARQVVTSAAFHNVGPGASRDALMTAFGRHASDKGATERLLKLANDPGFLALNDAGKEKKLLDRYGSDKAFAQGVDTLLGNANYTGPAATPTSDAQRAKVLGDVAKLAETRSYKDASPAHKQAMVEIVGDLSAFSAANPGRAPLRNSLDKVLDGSIRVELYSKAPRTVGTDTFHSWGKADERAIYLNVHPDTRAEATARNEYAGTLTHEVNHKLNGNTNAGTADRLLDEYRAAVVGEEMRLGRPLSPAEQRAELDNLVDGTNAAYSHLAHLYNRDAKVKAVVDAMRKTLDGAPAPAGGGAATPAATVSPEDLRARLLAAGKTSDYLNKAGNLDNH